MATVRTTPDTLTDDLIQSYRKPGLVKVRGDIARAEEYRHAAVDLQKSSMQSLHQGPIFTQARECLGGERDDEAVDAVPEHHE